MQAGIQSGTQAGMQSGNHLKTLHLYDINTSHFNWLSLHLQKLIDDNDIEELFTLCKANSLIDK